MNETFSNNLINNTIYHLLNFEKHGSFQAAAREAAINNNFQLVVLSEEFQSGLYPLLSTPRQTHSGGKPVREDPRMGVSEIRVP